METFEEAKARVIAETEEDMKNRGRSSFDSYDLYSWFRRYNNEEGKFFVGIIDEIEKILEGYTGLQINTSFERNTVLVSISDTYSGGHGLFRVTVKRKVIGETQYGGRKYAIADVIIDAFEPGIDSFDGVMRKAIFISDEMTGKAQKEVDDLRNELSRYGLTIKRLHELDSNFRNMSAQAKSIAEKEEGI